MTDGRFRRSSMAWRRVCFPARLRLRQPPARRLRHRQRPVIMFAQELTVGPAQSTITNCRVSQPEGKCGWKINGHGPDRARSGRLSSRKLPFNRQAALLAGFDNLAPTRPSGRLSVSYRQATDQRGFAVGQHGPRSTDGGGPASLRGRGRDCTHCCL